MMSRSIFLIVVDVLNYSCKYKSEIENYMKIEKFLFIRILIIFNNKISKSILNYK